MISQITLMDDETQKVVTDDDEVEHDQPASAQPFNDKYKRLQSKQSDNYTFSNSLAFHPQDSSCREETDSKQPVDPVSIRISKLQSTDVNQRDKTVTQGTELQQSS